MIKLKKEKKKDFVCDGCGKGYIGASRNSFIIRVAGYETYNIQLCNACLLSLKKKIKGYKQYGNRHLSKEKIDEYCNSVKEAKEKSLEK